ncbi:inorganic pyrophosphatase [Fulvitalea axinellae]|uniref:Inorganic pyrophosphatase n=1 Tax=Fulvitalea axinellae TaxID=1182444 RepID=A0AAU9CML8_9BACT|nr:inorganic pyrophosphatase [Fulvitalea axinellae]
MSERKEELTFDVLVEIPKGSRNKYEFDKEKGLIRYDRMIFSSMHYPSDYGYVPDTLALDGDALDALVLLSAPTFPGCLIECRTIGLFKMTDEAGEDNKLICVPVSDPVWNKIHDLDEINPHLKLEIEHFFQVYKDLEKKKVDVQGWDSKEHAEEAFHASVERYKQTKNI